MAAPNSDQANRSQIIDIDGVAIKGRSSTFGAGPTIKPVKLGRLFTIKRQIEAGTFSFSEEFPDYRFLSRVGGVP